MIYNFGGKNVPAVYNTAGTETNIAYNFAGNKIYEKGGGSVSWKDVKWVAVGDSLTDPSINATHKYHAVISEAVGLGSLKVLGVGGTGYWRGNENNKCFYQRMAGNIPYDTNIITIFGSVNDWRWESDGIQIGSVDDELDSGTYAGYVDKAIKVAKEQAPNAKILICGTPYFTNTVNSRHWRQATDMNKQKAEKYGLPFFDMFASNANGKPIDERYGQYEYMFNYDFKTRAKVNGLNFAKTNEANFKGIYDMSDATGHPSNRYHAEYIAPLMANYIATVIGIPKESIPASLQLNDGEINDFLDSYVTCTGISAEYLGGKEAGDNISGSDFKITTHWSDGTSFIYNEIKVDNVPLKNYDGNSVYVSDTKKGTGTENVTLKSGENTIYILYGSTSPFYSVKTSVSISV